jgi:hypothetical protein
MRTEYANNTPEQVREYLSDALEVLDALEVPEDLRVAAFNLAVNLFSAKQIMLEQTALAPIIGPRH